MIRILFRCDSSFSIGSGHAIRCRALARQLQSRGAEVLFLCRRMAGDLIALLEREFRVLALPEHPPVPCEGLEGRDLYRAWLGCSQNQDAHDCLTALASAGVSTADWLVVDHYGLDAIWEAQLVNALAGDKSTPRLMTIDDLADRPHRADLLVDQNFFGDASEHRYRGLLPPQCQQLLGPQYALMGPEYAHLHPLVPPRTELRRLLVFFGGVDPANLTARALEALLDPVVTDLAVDVVLGLQCPNRSTVEELVGLRPNTTLHGPKASLAGLIARADLAIGAVGATTWERACLGLPCISIPLADNQIPVSQVLALHDFIRLIRFRPETFRSKLLYELSVFSHPDYIQRVSQACRSLTKGEGAQICTEYLLYSRN